MVEGHCVLPRVASRAHGAGRDAGRQEGARGAGELRAGTGVAQAACDRGARSVQGVTVKVEGRAQGAAHVKHHLHVPDEGGVPARDIYVAAAHVAEEVVHAYNA